MEQAVTFPAAGNTLEGLLSLPAGTARVGVVVCHPHPLRGGEMRNNVVSALVEGFRSAGHATLRFNFRGVGASSGVHDDGNGEQDDVKAAVGYLLSRQQVEAVAVAGYSFGSLVGLKAGGRDPRVHKLVGVALPIATRDASFLRSVAKPKLLISGDCDDISPAGKLAELHASIPEPRSLVLVEGADHFFWGQEAEVARAAVAFV